MSTTPVPYPVAARELLNIIPDHDNACCALIAAFVEVGSPAEAVREFERYEQACARLKTPPSSRATALIEDVRAQLHSRHRLASAGSAEPRETSQHLSGMPTARETHSSSNAAPAEPTIVSAPTARTAARNLFNVALSVKTDRSRRPSGARASGGRAARPIGQAPAT